MNNKFLRTTPEGKSIYVYLILAPGAVELILYSGYETDNIRELSLDHNILYGIIHKRLIHYMSIKDIMI